MTTDKNGHEITSEDVEELESKLSVAKNALEKIAGRGMTGGCIARKALKEIQQHDLPDFARFENRSNTTTDVDK